MFVEIFLGIIVFFVGVYLHLKFNKWNYFSKRGIPELKTSTYKFWTDFIFQRRHINDMFKEGYQKTKGEDYYGLFSFGAPVLVIKNIDLIKRILVKDFDHFVDRQTNNFEKVTSRKSDQAWSRQLSSLEGDEWKNVRSTFSPIFTSGKMKAMMVFIKETSRRLIEEMKKHAQAGEEFELKECFGKFSMDTLASCAFGVDSGAFNKEESPFVRNAAGIFSRNTLELIKFVTVTIPGMAKVFNFFKISLFKQKETEFFIDVIERTLRERKQNPSLRKNDLIDMMVEAMKGEITHSEASDQFDVDSAINVDKSKKKEIDEITVVATAMLMLVAGYDTTAQTLGYAAFEMVKNQDMQDKLRAEIDAAYEDADGMMPDYTVIQNLPYLDMVVHEALRLHPPAGILSRVCVKDYKVDERLTMTKGMMLFIAVSSVHQDPDNYPNPEVFNPEHFSKEAKKARSPHTFLSFGQGPRACLAMRFALLEAKVGLMSVIRHYKLLPSPKTVDKIVLDPKSGLGGNMGGLWGKAELRDL